jgi:hypothetical protein
MVKMYAGRRRREMGAGVLVHFGFVFNSLLAYMTCDSSNCVFVSKYFSDYVIFLKKNLLF